MELLNRIALISVIAKTGNINGHEARLMSFIDKSTDDTGILLLLMKERKGKWKPVAVSNPVYEKERLIYGFIDASDSEVYASAEFTKRWEVNITGLINSKAA